MVIRIRNTAESGALSSFKIPIRQSEFRKTKELVHQFPGVRLEMPHGKHFTRGETTWFLLPLFLVEKTKFREKVFGNQKRSNEHSKVHKQRTRSLPSTGPQMVFPTRNGIAELEYEP